MLVRLGTVLFVACALFSLNIANANEKPRIAVMQAVVSDGVSKSIRRHLRLDVLHSELERSIQNARKFSVVTRDKSKMSALMKEQAFSQSAASRGNAAQSGQMDAANFLVMTTVKDFVFWRSSKAVPNIDNKYRRKDSGRLKVEVQIQDTSSGEIKATFDLVDSFASKTKIVNKKGGAPAKINFEKMAKKVAALAADQLVDTVFPMKVMSVDGRAVFINRGKDGGLKKGDKLVLYSPGAVLIDPDTGENLGSTEREVGLLKVSRVNPKFTIAKIIELDEDEFVESGFIVRRP
ncbi:MAG: FlgT C-terminal domain-containing protein [Terasakiella sp.]|uniref:FlgT C-terminal domain-containing protein n=1 Tax=unclassified Terasakiella TaxID=2614952 RepID=UPI003B007E66